MADRERDAREAHAARTLANLKDFEKVGADGRLRVIHNELYYAIDRIVNEQKAKPVNGARFNEAETEILLSVALQIIAVLDSSYRPRPGPLTRLCREFWALGPLKKAGIIGAIVVTLVGGAYTLFKDMILSKSEAGHRPATTTPAPSPAVPPPAKPNDGTPHG